MIKRGIVIFTALATPLAPVAADTCNAAAGQGDPRCDVYKKTARAIAQTITPASSGTTLTDTYELAVSNPNGGEFRGRWPDQRSPAVTLLRREDLTCLLGYAVDVHEDGPQPTESNEHSRAPK